MLNEEVNDMEENGLKVYHHGHSHRSSYSVLMKANSHLYHRHRMPKSGTTFIIKNNANNIRNSKGNSVKDNGPKPNHRVSRRSKASSMKENAPEQANTPRVFRKHQSKEYEGGGPRNMAN